MCISTATVRASGLDYRFGWRWLLPVGDDKRTASIGLSADEQHWWEQTQSLTVISNQSESVDGYLIALDVLSPDAIAIQINSATPRWLCAWGSGSSIDYFRSSLRGFASVREYGLLPAGHPRVVVPLSSSRFAEAGLRLHRPGSWLARLGLLVASGLVRLGYFGLLRRRVLLIASREADAVPQGLAQAGVAASLLSARSDYALYLGTPDDNRKTVVLPLGDASSSVILKVAEMPKARAALQNEARALSTMGRTPLAEKVPKFISLVETDARVVLSQEYRQRQSIGHTRMTAAVVNFLADISKIEHKRVALSDWLKWGDAAGHTITATRLSPSVEEAVTYLRTRLAEIASCGGQVLVHRSHGDFAPWNCAWTDRGVFVFDWEESREQGLALGDAFYYVLSPFVHVHNNPDAAKALASAIQFASDVASRSSSDIVAGSASHIETDVRMYLALWLLGRLNQSPFYGELAVRLERSWT